MRRSAECKQAQRSNISRWRKPSGLQKLTKDLKSRGLEAMRELEDARRTGARTDKMNPQTILHRFKVEAMRLARAREMEIVPRLLAEIREREKALKLVYARSETTEQAKISEAGLLTKQIRELKQKRYKQQQQNARAAYRLYGDKPTRYWSKLHKECAPRDIIGAFEIEGRLGVAGEKLYETHSVKMAEMARVHHMNVQRDDETVRQEDERSVDIETALDSLEVSVSEQQAAKLGDEISYEECELSLRFAKNGSAPGIDGFPFEVWKTLHARYREDIRFPDRTSFDVVKLLTAAFEDARKHGVDPKTSLAYGWIAPIYKEKGERTRVVNYRPITLLNTDYKLLSKILAIRLADVAPSIINKAQAGFVPGRKIHNHTQLARMMILWAEENDADGAIVALDQEKAYDKIAHDYLWKVLERFGIPGTMIQLIQSLYKYAKTSVMINGILSKPYQIYRGVRQGDPLSCLLFDLAIEPLSAMIRKSDIEGFNIPRCNEVLKAVLFADDTTVYLSSNDDFRVLQDILDTWCSAAKARFNMGKTEIIPIGRATFREEMAQTYRATGAWKNYPRGVHVTQEGEAVRILGAFFGNGIDQVGVWSLVLAKIVAMRKPLLEVIERWKNGHATIQGKKHVVQMIVGGMTQYLTAVQRMPEPIRVRLDKIIRNYIWNDRRNSPVGIKHLHLPVNQGGLGLLDLEARNEAVDVMWLKAYLDLSNNRPTWAYIADDLFATYVTKDCRPQKENLRINPFLQQWQPRVRGLPEELSSMMRVAKKYGVRLEGLAFSREIMNEMPMWSHAYADRKKMGRLTVPSKLLTCLQEKHKARTVGDFCQLAATISNMGHRPRAGCTCASCSRLREATGCENPHLCSMRAKEMISTIPDKWNPCLEQPEDYEAREMKDLVQEDLGDGVVPFDRRITTHGPLGQALRIFTDGEPVSNAAICTKVKEDGSSLIIATDGSCSNNGEREARAGAGVYVEGDLGRNSSARLPAHIEQSNQTAEIAAALLATTTADSATRVLHETDSKTTMDSITKWRQAHEDTGYITQKNAGLTRATIAGIRQRSGHTLLKWVKGHNGHPRNEAADRLAALGAMKATGDRISIDIPLQFKVSGAKLQAVTQKLAYRAIRSRKDKLVRPRPRAAANLDRVVCGVRDTFGTHIYDETIWISLRAKHVSRQISHFLWMAMHDGYMIGTHWLRPKMPPDLQKRAFCEICGECETMTHIVLECNAVGQTTVWGLLKDLWSHTKAKWFEPCWGTTFGAANAVFKSEEGTRKAATENLWCILSTEALHLIWRLRCERVIQNQGEEFTENEIINRFYATMNSRLTLDRRTAALARGKRSLKPQDIERIWLPIIENNSELPPKWVVNCGVLVGIKRGR